MDERYKEIELPNNEKHLSKFGFRSGGSDAARVAWFGLLLVIAACGTRDFGSEVSFDFLTSPTARTISITDLSPDARVRTMLDDDGHISYLRDCGDPSDGRAHCSVLLPSDSEGNVIAIATPYGLGANDIENAYGIALSTSGGGRTVAIVTWGDDPNTEADLAVYRSQYNLPSCTTANGCFKKLNQNGLTSPLPAPAPNTSNQAEEYAIDVDMVSAACPFCNIVVIEANTGGDSDLMVAEDLATSLADFISNSWGAVDYSYETMLESHFQNPGKAYFASSGDKGYGNFWYPAASEYVTAVGGTVLTAAPGTSRGWSETTWLGSAAGCSQYIGKPAWQHDGGCPRRASVDVSAIGYNAGIYDSWSSDGWYSASGTSVAAPLMAGIYANGGNRGAGPSISYTTAAFNDVTTGVDLSGCSSYLCSAAVGYDYPTGNGTPVATNLIHYNTLFGHVTSNAYADGVAINDANVYVLRSNGVSFTSSTQWLDEGFYGAQATLLGDVNGDGLDDIVAFGGSYIAVTLSFGTAFLSPLNWLNVPFYGTHATLLGDVNKDGRADAIAINDNSTWVALANSPSSLSFAAPVQWSSVPFYGTMANLAGDVDGDGRTDLIAVNQPNTYVMLSNGSSFGTPVQWSSVPFYGTMATLIGDVNGDHKKDLIAINQTDIWVMLSTGTGFASPTRWRNGGFYGEHATVAADVNGDGYVDLVAMHNNSVFVSLSNGSSFGTPQNWFNSPFFGNH